MCGQWLIWIIHCSYNQQTYEIETISLSVMFLIWGWVHSEKMCYKLSKIVRGLGFNCGLRATIKMYSRLGAGWFIVSMRYSTNMCKLPSTNIAIVFTCSRSLLDGREDRIAEIQWNYFVTIMWQLDETVCQFHQAHSYIRYVNHSHQLWLLQGQQGRSRVMMKVVRESHLHHHLLLLQWIQRPFQFAPLGAFCNEVFTI